MTKHERIAIFYLLIVSTITIVLNFVILNQKISQSTKIIPVQAEKTIISPDCNPEIKLSTDSAKLNEELKAIRNELNQTPGKEKNKQPLFLVSGN